MQEVNVDLITDVDKLKALAYDQIAAKEVAEKNLAAINGRIMQLLQTVSRPPKKNSSKS